MNPDMQGYVVRVSNFVTHLGTAMLIAWSNKSPRSYYRMLFLQILFILIGVFASIGRDQLNIDDVRFAVILTHSPTCAYCVLLVLPRLLIKTLPDRARALLNDLPADHALASSWNRWMSELNSTSVTDGFYGVLIAVLCLALNISVQSNGLTHLYSTEDSGGFQIPTTTAAAVLHRCLLLGAISVPVYECVLVRHRELRRRLLRHLASEQGLSRGPKQTRRRHKAQDPPLKSRFNWKRRARGFVATWYITLKLHPWILFFYAVVMFEHWARKLRIWTVESNFKFSYGQFLALGPSVPVAWECMKLAIHRRSDIAKIPRLFIQDVVWIVTGKGQPWCGDDPDLCDLWNMFPADELSPEPELPHFSRPSLFVARGALINTGCNVIVKGADKQTIK
ncbi:hypothetical protein C8F01DRAFT_1373082 [Mycena amicta]|nr:hypothetical protein C8F01DRAFT_1373082 [Mycena amicta]